MRLWLTTIPFDYHKLKRLVGQRVDSEYDTEQHRAALSNLKELDMVERGGIGHEYVHITDGGWEYLGGKTPRHDNDVGAVDASVCTVCAKDELVESGW